MTSSAPKLDTAVPASAPPPADSREQVSAFMKAIQDQICEGLATADGGTDFQQDQWERPEGGGGRSRVLKQGNVFEQGGVNFSEVWGSQLPPSILVQRPEAAGHGFYATGTSMVLHPQNPYIPTVHLNYRYFEAGPVWWFGGGIDLTPYYADLEDVQHFHRTLKQACDRHHPDYYPTFKHWCDEYFYLKHRQETRGVGGIFFDYQDGRPVSFIAARTKTVSPPSTVIRWVRFPAAVGKISLALSSPAVMLSCPPIVPIVDRHRDQDYGDRQRNFQLYRRGRYVEFNLVYDRGTIFGLQTNGRTESILMSLPPMVRWEYGYQPEPGTPEAALYETFLKPQDWLALETHP
jgi:coproporphyrinogen III oxidase